MKFWNNFIIWNLTAYWSLSMNITIFIEILNIYHLGMQTTITDIFRLTIYLYAGLYNKL